MHKKIIHLIQVGFPNMQGYFDTQKPINAIHYINKLKKKNQ